MTTLTKPVPVDRSKIDMKSSQQVKAWVKNLDISIAELAKVIETVGNSAAAVRKELVGRCRPKRRPVPTEHAIQE